MKIERSKQFNYVLNLNYPIIEDNVQKDLDDTDSIVFSRWVSKKAITMCANRLECILANNPDNFDLDVELSNLHDKVDSSWQDNNGCCKCLELPKGSIKKLIGRELSWNDEPVELKEE